MRSSWWSDCRMNCLQKLLPPAFECERSQALNGHLRINQIRQKNINVFGHTSGYRWLYKSDVWCVWIEWWILILVADWVWPERWLTNMHHSLTWQIGGGELPGKSIVVFVSSSVLWRKGAWPDTLKRSEDYAAAENRSLLLCDIIMMAIICHAVTHRWQMVLILRWATSICVYLNGISIKFRANIAASLNLNLNNFEQ